MCISLLSRCPANGIQCYPIRPMLPQKWPITTPLLGKKPELQQKTHLSLGLRWVCCFYLWCPGEDSNLHTLRHMDLNHARLPIPPPGHKVYASALPCFCGNTAVCVLHNIFKRRKV